MNASELLCKLDDLGVDYWADAAGEKIRLRGSGTRPDEALWTQLREWKPEILTILTSRQTSGPGRYRCAKCWAWFPEAELTVVDETIGKGFRCVDCLR